ncbi:MAG: AraC family ligand binding domain-containing protein [Streptococcus sp.]|nr:AraC family ligand binding domain-containing protein [Streptococcus sp.]
MKYYKINPNSDFAETPVKEEARIIHHLHLEKGKDVSEHSADALVTVICLSGDVDFTAEGEQVRLVSGSFLTMEPNELHKLFANEESHLLVIKQLKY